MPKKEIIEPQTASSLAIISFVLGVVSLTGPGLLLGVPAIITAIISLKKDAGGRGLGIAGLITGIVSTIISLLLIVVFMLLVIWGVNHPEEFKDMQRNNPQTEHTYDSSRT